MDGGTDLYTSDTKVTLTREREGERERETRKRKEFQVTATFVFPNFVRWWLRRLPKKTISVLHSVLCQPRWRKSNPQGGRRTIKKEHEEMFVLFRGTGSGHAWPAQPCGEPAAVRFTRDERK